MQDPEKESRQFSLVDILEATAPVTFFPRSKEDYVHALEAFYGFMANGDCHCKLWAFLELKCRQEVTRQHPEFSIQAIAREIIGAKGIINNKCRFSSWVKHEFIHTLQSRYHSETLELTPIPNYLPPTDLQLARFTLGDARVESKLLIEGEMVYLHELAEGFQKAQEHRFDDKNDLSQNLQDFFQQIFGDFSN
jgi:hypothetical protein